MSYEKCFTYNQVKVWHRLLGNRTCKGQESVLRGFQVIQLGRQETPSLLNDV